MDATAAYVAVEHQELMDYLDSINTVLRNRCLGSPGLTIGSSAPAKIKIASTTPFTSGGVFKSKTTAEVAFTATTHDIAAVSGTVREAVYLVTLAADGTPTITMGAVASGSGAARLPARPTTGTPIGYARVAVEGAAQSATAVIGAGANGTVTTTVDATGTAGNAFTIEVVLGSGNNVALSAAIVSGAVTVTLGTGGGGLADATKNTATLVTAAITALAGVTAAASGTGVTAIPAAEGPTTFAGGAAAGDSFDASTDSLAAGHLTVTYVDLGDYAPRFDSAQ